MKIDSAVDSKVFEIKSLCKWIQVFAAQTAERVANAPQDCDLDLLETILTETATAHNAIIRAMQTGILH